MEILCLCLVNSDLSFLNLSSETKEVYENRKSACFEFREDKTCERKEVK